MSPIFGSRSLPAEVTENRALRVNRMAWRRSLRVRNCGSPIFRGIGPFRPAACHSRSAFR
jgi:hypothetical protein